MTERTTTMGQLGTIKVKDNTGKENEWFIEEELDKAYQVFSNGIITYIYKASCYCIKNQLFSFETRNNDYPNCPSWFDYICCSEDRSIDMGYLEPDWYGLDIIYDEDGSAYGV